MKTFGPAVQVLEALGEVAAGLLVLELADQEGRHAIALQPRARRAVGEQRRRPERVLPLELERVLGLQAQLLVGAAVLVARLDELPGPGLAAGRRGLGVVHALDHPGLREARVEDAARVAGAGVEVVGHRQRRDRRQVRRLRAGGEQLGDPGERDAAHADLAALDPLLGGDRLDRVVAVVGRRVVEQVEGAARAARAAHLHADHGEAEQRADQRADRGRVAGASGSSACRRAIDWSRSCGAADLVARVLDERRERAVAELLARRQAHGHRQLDAVAHLHVVEALLELLAP